MTILLQGLKLFKEDEVTHILKITIKKFHSKRTTMGIKLLIRTGIIKVTWIKINLMANLQNIIYHPKIIFVKGI